MKLRLGGYNLVNLLSSPISESEPKLQKGDCVVLCYSFGLPFYAGVFGCLWAGLVLVVPPNPNKMSMALAKMSNVISNSNAKLVLIDNAVNLLRNNPLSKSRALWPKNVEYKVHPRFLLPMSGQQIEEFRSLLDNQPIKPNDLAFLQYTSGSTGDPKGVMVTYKALWANVLALIGESLKVFEAVNVSKEKEKVLVSWLPQYHDMGLIGAFIFPFAAGCSTNMISPFDFIRNPLLWINLISQVKAFQSVAPNFAYRLVAKRFIEAKKRSAEPIPNLDLSSVALLQSEAEPIQSDTRDIFHNAFGSYGLRKN